MENSNIDVNPLGSKWIGRFNSEKEKESCIIFFPNGILKYGDINSSWEIKQGKIFLSINSGFATLYGHRENNRLFGNAANIQKQEWTFEFKLVDTEKVLEFLANEHKEDPDKIKITENIVLKLGKKWSLKNYLLFESETFNIEIAQNRILKVNNNIEEKWEIINGRIVFKFSHIKAEYNGEIIQNRIFGLAKNNKGEEWIFSGELIPEVEKPKNSKVLKIKAENRGHGLMASTDETWNNFKLLDNGFYFEDDNKIILTSIIGQEYIASKGEVPWEATMYNRSYEEDKKSNDIFYGRNPNGGQFLIYRSKNSQVQNEITIGVLNVKSDGITFKII